MSDRRVLSLCILAVDMQTVSGGPAVSSPGISLVASPSAVARIRRWLRRDNVIAILVLSPSLLAVAIFIYSFIVWTFYVSLTAWNSSVIDLSFAGLERWESLITDSRWLQDLRNMFVYAAGFMSQCLLIGFLLACLLDQKIKAESVFRTIFIFPFAVSGIVTGVVWRWLMAPETGLNLIFSTFGLDFLRWKWYTDPTYGIIAVSIAGAWQFSGYVMALYLAGLRGISSDLREAAAIDGCSTFSLYRHIIIPLLAPVTFTALVLTGMGSIRVFDIPAILGTGAALGADAMAYYMFTLTFQMQKYGSGATVACMMIIFAAFLVVPYMLSMHREADQ
jgi:glucose/mannose transport system permease protein